MAFYASNWNGLSGDGDTSSSFGLSASKVPRFTTSANQYYRGYGGQSQGSPGQLLNDATGNLSNRGTQSFVADPLAQKAKWSQLSTDMFNQFSDIKAAKDESEARVYAAQQQAAARNSAAQAQSTAGIFGAGIGLVGSIAGALI